MSLSKIRLVSVFYLLLIVLASLLPVEAVSFLPDYNVGHFLAYTGMAVLALLSFRSKTARFVALLAAVVLGGLLEWGQSFVPERNMSLIDETANTLGVLSGTLFFRFKSML
jgi:VanZ family protein